MRRSSPRSRMAIPSRPRCWSPSGPPTRPVERPHWRRRWSISTGAAQRGEPRPWPTGPVGSRAPIGRRWAPDAGIHLGTGRHRSVEGLRPEWPGRQRRHRRNPISRAARGRAAPADRMRGRGPGHLVRRTAQRGRRGHGSVRVGEVHAGELPDPAVRADRGDRPARRRGSRRGRRQAVARAPPQPVRDGIPELRPLTAPAGHRQRRVRARGSRRREGPAARAGPRGARPGGPDRVRGLLPRPALRRNAAASRARPGPGRRPGRAVLRRAVLGPGPADPPRHAERGHPAAPRGRQDAGVHHPRSARGAAARRSHPDHARGRDGPARPAGRGRRCSGGRLRARLRRRRAALASTHPVLGHAPAGPRRPDGWSRAAAGHGRARCRPGGALRRRAGPGGPRRRVARPGRLGGDPAGHGRRGRGPGASYPDRRGGRMTTATVAAGSVPWWRRVTRPWIVAGILVAWVVLGTLLRGRDTMALATQDTTPLHNSLTDVRNWVDSHRATAPLFSGVLDTIRTGVGSLTSALQDLNSQPSFDRPVPLIGWLGVVVLATFGAYALGNLRVAILTAAGFVAVGLLGLWQESMDTLALTVAAVLLSLVIGIPLGVYVALSPTAERLVTPVLDTMQAMPTLAPLTLFFLIGPPAAVIATLIYAMPPVVRLTALGIRQVNAAALEASRSLGATRWQLLRTVQLPMAKRTIVVGINQTTMAAFSMVMIAALIAGPGLGQTVLQGLSALDVGRAFTAGLAIVILAIVLDRVTTAASERAETTYRAGVNERTRRTRRWILAGGGALAVIALYLSYSYYWASTFPGPKRGGVIGFTIDDAVNSATDWARHTLHPMTDAITKGVTYGLINPLQTLIAESPWYLVCAVVLALTWTLAGERSLIVASVCLGLLLASGLWASSMVTLTSVLVATIIVVVLGVVVGVVLADSPWVDVRVRPELHASQGLPPFVYHVPFVGLFAPTRLTAIIAAVVSALPVVIKIVVDGIRAVPPATVEAGIASGSSRWQIITKVQLPQSRNALALGANQGLIYVLSVVVIGGLVGAGALGYLVVAGFSQSELFGKGLAAGAAIVVLGILLDRVTQAAARRAQDREHRLTKQRQRSKWGFQ